MRWQAVHLHGVHAWGKPLPRAVGGCQDLNLLEGGNEEGGVWFGGGGP